MIDRPDIHEYVVDGRTKILADGTEATLIAIMDVFGRKGAKNVEFAWSSPLIPVTDHDAPAGVPVTWTCTATWFYSDNATVGAHGPTADHVNGMLLAALEVLRQRGVNVTVIG